MDFGPDGTPPGLPGLPGLRVAAVAPPIRTSKYDLVLTLRTVQDDLGGELTYSTDLFDERTAVAYGEAAQQVPAAVTADPDIPIPEPAGRLRSRWSGAAARTTPVSGEKGNRPSDPSEAADQDALTGTERALLALWRDTLENAELGVDDHFFQAGGHSMPAIRLIGRMRETFDVELPATLVFEAPTVRAPATRVAAATG